MLLVSGNANNGTNAGFAYSNANNAPSNANAYIGSQLCFQYTAIIQAKALPLGKKIKTAEKVLVLKRKAPKYESGCNEKD